MAQMQATFTCWQLEGADPSMHPKICSSEKPMTTLTNSWKRRAQRLQTKAWIRDKLPWVLKIHFIVSMGSHATPKAPHKHTQKAFALEGLPHQVHSLQTPSWLTSSLFLLCPGVVRTEPRRRQRLSGLWRLLPLTSVYEPKCKNYQLIDFIVRNWELMLPSKALRGPVK